MTDTGFHKTVSSNRARDCAPTGDNGRDSYIRHIISLVTIHSDRKARYNYGKGKSPGTISIYQYDNYSDAKKSINGKLLGTWNASGRGDGNAPDKVFYWDIFPNVVFRSGYYYELVDSDMATVSYNYENNSPVYRLYGYAITGPAVGKVSDWAKDEVQEAVNKGLLPDCLYGADMTQPITRAEFAAVAVKLYEYYTGKSASMPSSNPFRDTSDAEVQKAYNLGITNGYGNSYTFAPNVVLNRETCATMLSRVYKKVFISGWTIERDSKYSLTSDNFSRYADNSDISDWAWNSVYFMSLKGVIYGVGNNRFAPKQTAYREQALIIALRMANNLVS
mgnify:CR=1 FL=1